MLGVRWVDVKTADGSHTSRLVSKDNKTYNAPELLAATQPIESLIYILRRAARNQRQPLMRIDVPRAYLAYFYVDAVREVYVQLPPEGRAEGDKHMCGQLVRAMYSVRDAALNWQRHFMVMKELGFSGGKVSPCFFYHENWGKCGLVHSDDVVFEGLAGRMLGIAELMAGKFKIGMATTGPERQAPLTVLNRIIRRTPSGIAYESHRRHANRRVEELGLNPKGVVTPALHESRMTARQRSTKRTRGTIHPALARPMRARVGGGWGLGVQGECSRGSGEVSVEHGQSPGVRACRSRNLDEGKRRGEPERDAERGGHTKAEDATRYRAMLRVATFSEATVKISV